MDQFDERRKEEIIANIEKSKKEYQERLKKLIPAVKGLRSLELSDEAIRLILRVPKLPVYS